MSDDTREREMLEIPKERWDALQAQVAQMREALESITERHIGIPTSTVFRRSAIIHGGFEHSDTDEARAQCRVCVALSSSPASQRWKAAMKDNRTIEVGWNEGTGKFDAWVTDWDTDTPSGAEPSGLIVSMFDGAESPVAAVLGVLAALGTEGVRG